MGRVDINLKISKDAAEIKQNDMTGTLTIEAALKQAKINFEKSLNRLNGLHEIIKAVRGEDDDI